MAGQANGPAAETAAQSRARSGVASAEGTWTAEITYPNWGSKTFEETFVLQQTGNRISGTASFLGHARPIREGKAEDGIISFTTRWELIPEGSGSQENFYRGTVAGDEIRFVYQDLRAGGRTIPFTARRSE